MGWNDRLDIEPDSHESWVDAVLDRADVLLKREKESGFTSPQFSGEEMEPGNG